MVDTYSMGPIPEGWSSHVQEPDHLSYALTPGQNGACTEPLPFPRSHSRAGDYGEERCIERADGECKNEDATPRCHTVSAP